MSATIETHGPLDLLTDRQREVATLVAAGFENPAIERMLDCSKQAVSSRLHQVFIKLGVSSRVELALLLAGHDLPSLTITHVAGERDEPSRELDALRVEVEELRMAPRFAPRRWRPGTPPTRQSLAVAVRRVGTARGRRETVQRLHELAAEAEAWAARVDSRCNPDPQSALQGRTTS